MSRLEDLIQSLCPDGVDFIPLEEVLDYSQPTPYIVKSTLYDDSFDTPVLTAGASFILGYTDEKKGIYCASYDKPVIIFDDFTTSFHWVDFNFKVKSSAMKILTELEQKPVVLRYVFYAMQCITYQPSQHARQWIQTYSKIRIPLPPLPVQAEIVRILDTFSSAVTELEAEHAARVRHYEHYRDVLLMFDDRVIFKKLGEAGSFFGGLSGKTKTDFQNGNCKFITYMNVYKNPAVDTDINDYVKINPNERQNIVQFGDVLFTGSSETPEECGISSVMTIKPIEPYYLNSFTIGFRLHSLGLLTPDFSKHLFRSSVLRKQINKTANGVTRFNVSKAKLAEVIIPLPPLEVQEQIVSILDRFDTLVNDLKSGLPAEIALRRKQYEYYRDKLLTFPAKQPPL